MESARAVNASWPSLRRDLLTALLVSGLAAFAFVVVLLLTRRVTGALVQPLGGLSLVGVAGLGLTLVGAWRLGWQATGSRETFLAPAAPVLPGVALFLLLCALSLPGTANWALMLSWLAFFICEAAWWWAAYSANQQRVARRAASPWIPAETTAAAETEDCDELADGNVFQQITRSHEGELERISARLRLDFSVGQRVVVTHIAFCPPLAAVPELEAEVTDGPDASVSLTNVQTFGLRMEVRLSEPMDEPCSVTIDVAGQTHRLLPSV